MSSVLGNKRMVLLLIGPALVFYTAVTIIPMLWSVRDTLYSGGLIEGMHYTGFSNYSKFFHDPTAISALWLTIRYALIITFGQVFLGYLLALLYVFFLRRASSIIRTFVFFPVVLPTVAVALLFQQIFQLSPVAGPVNVALHALGLSGSDFLGSTSGAFMVLIVMDLWRSMGFYGVLLYTGLLDIPDEVIESARVDGAKGWSLVRRIILPLSMPILLSSLIFSINGTLKVFDSIVALTNGGPGSATTPLTLYMFNTAFSYGNYGYGATIAFMLTLLCLIVSVVIFRWTRRDPTRS